MGRVTTDGNANRVRRADPGTSALLVHPLSDHRSRAALRAAITRSRMSALDSPTPPVSAAVPAGPCEFGIYVPAEAICREDGGLLYQRGGKPSTAHG